MDLKLAEYRAKKKREHFIKSTKEKLFRFLRRRDVVGEMKENEVIEKDEDVEFVDDQSSTVSSDSANDTVDEYPCCDELTVSKISLYATLWLILFSFAVYLEFGAVYFVISSLYIIWANTRTGPKNRGEISAYSVFNHNCEAIDGTLKPEQFENEIRYGIL